MGGRVRRHLRDRLEGRRIGQKVAIGLAVIAILSGILTYAVMTGGVPFIRPDSRNVLTLLLVDLICLLSLGAIIARSIVVLWAGRRRQQAGSRLHVRLVVLFSVIAVVPAIVVASFSVLFFHFGLQSWFSDRVRTALDESVAVAEAYLTEHKQVIVGDVLAMANDLNREGPVLFANPMRLQQFVDTQARIRALTEAVVFDSDGRVLARSGLTFGLSFEPVPEWAIEEALRGGVPTLTSDDDDRIRALVRLQSFDGGFLYVGRYVERRVLNHLERVREAVSAYESAEGQRVRIEITFAILFATVALLFLLAAVWVGFQFASSLARPVTRLVEAAERVRAGDLTVRVRAADSSNELDTLSRAFNRMTSQLEAQRHELVEANRQLDERRRFTEAVLSGVASGVIGLDAEGHINLPNRVASELLLLDLQNHVGKKLADVVPEMAPALEDAQRRPWRAVEHQVDLAPDGRIRTLLVRVTAEGENNVVSGHVVTFTDITELLSAQRKAAWSDIARRIAHEIKNPLTPIQLSAERLRRKYLKEIESDPDTFRECTDTIVRQVDDLRRMVDEFSSFARMPVPIMKPTDLFELARQSVFLQRQAQPEIAFELKEPRGRTSVMCDRRQIGQVLTNLLQNASDAIVARLEAEPDGPRGWVGVMIEETDGSVELAVEDNGVGLPHALLDKLTEPYVTTRTKGTGLGLAIVKKIMEDHGGEIAFSDRGDGGARVRVSFPPPESVAFDSSGVNEAPKTAHSG